MKIFLTGGRGMVGRNIRECADAGEHAILAPTSGELNLFDYDKVLAFLKAERPDLVIHSAGKVGGIQANMADKTGFLTDNLRMGMNVVNASLEAGVPRLLNLSSSCMYPRNFEGAIPESSILTGELEPTNEGYAIAKIAVTRLCEYISAEKKGFSYKTIIPCNLYGRFDKFDPKHSHLIPAVIRKVDEAKRAGKAEVDIWGDGTARREFMYAGDLAQAVFDCIGKFEQLPQNLNVGLGYDYTINEYYDAVAKVVGFGGKFVHDLSKPVGMKRKLSDVTRMKGLGIRRDSGLEQGIRKTYEFYLEQGR